MATEKVEVYVLDVRVPKEDSRRIRVEGELSLGSDAGCDIRITDFGLAPLQGRFRLQNNVLTFTQLGPDDSLKVGSQKCGHGRMYILDKGDKCVIDKVKLIVRKEKVEIKTEEDADLDDLEDEIEEDSDSEPADQTDTGISAQGPNEDEGTEEHAVDSESNEEDEEEFEYVEEVVYVDEDGNEVAPEKKPGFFARLFKKKEKKKEKAGPPKRPALKGRSAAPNFKKGRKVRAAVAGPLYRLLGLTYNLGFFIFFYDLGLPLIKEKSGFDLLSYADKAITLLKPHLKKLPKSLPKEIAEVPYVADSYNFLKEALVEPTYYKYLIAFLVYETVFQLVFGIGLGQFMVGLYNGGNAILKRLLAPIRVLLSVILLPLLIFDLPIIFGKRSFKEIMTFSNYAKKSLARTLILAFFVIPLLMVLAANYQLYSAFLEKNPKITSTEREVKVPKSKDKEEKIKFQSLSFNAKGATVLKKKVRIIPSIHVKGNILQSKIVGADLNAKFTDILRRPNFLKKEEILEIIKKDPLLPLFSSELSMAAQNDSMKAVALNNEALMKVLFYSLNLDIKNPIPNLLALGPILGPYYELQKYIYSKMNAKRVTIVELIHGAKGDMIHLGNSDRLADHYILRLNDEGIDVINFSHTQESQGINTRIMESVFFVSEPSSSTYEKQIEKGLKKEKLMERSFVVLDIFDHVIKGNKITKPEFEFILSFYAKLSLDALDNGNEDYQQIVIDTFVALDTALVRVIKKNKDKQLEILRENLNNVQQALKKRKRDTLEVNSK